MRATRTELLTAKLEVRNAFTMCQDTSIRYENLTIMLGKIYSNRVKLLSSATEKNPNLKTTDLKNKPIVVNEVLKKTKLYQASNLDK